MKSMHWVFKDFKLRRPPAGLFVIFTLNLQPGLNLIAAPALQR